MTKARQKAVESINQLVIQSKQTYIAS